MGKVGEEGMIDIHSHILYDIDDGPDDIYESVRLCEIGFDKTQIYTTLELRMKCGVGKCGRCNVGAKYVCKDGPVFRCDELDELPAEY